MDLQPGDVLVGITPAGHVFEYNTVTAVEHDQTGDGPVRIDAIRTFTDDRPGAGDGVAVHFYAGRRAIHPVLRRALTTRECDEINHLQHAALWYAWGRQDAGDHRVSDADGFRTFVGSRVVAYKCGETSFLPSIRDQWENYCRQVTR